jgi:ABC-type transport system substrate-binding protein
MRRTALLLGLALLPAACGGGSEDDTGRAANPGVKAGGTLTVAIGRPAAIDPALAFEPWGRLVASLLCDPLIQLDAVTGEPIPALAASWIVGRGGTQITLKLRKGIRFHDGSAMSVDDVTFALSRVASQELGSNLAPLLRPVAGWAEVHGDVEARTPEAATALAGARVAGTDAVQITLAQPRADFLRVLGLALSSPVPRAAVTRDAAAFEAQPVCTGPYKLERPWKRSDGEIVLVRFDGYYGANRGYTRGGRGWADRIVLRVTDRPAPAAGIDAAPLSSDNAPAGFAVANGTLPYLEYLAVPLAQPPFDRREVRLALSRALDRDAIARTVYNGTRQAAAGFLPPTLGSIARPAACADAPASGDVTGARRALAGTDLRGGEIHLAYNPNFRNAALMEAVAQAWRSQLGLRVRLVPIPWDRYIEAAGSAERRTSGTSAAAAVIDGPFRMGWEAPYPGPDALLGSLFSSSAIGTNNVTRFSDPRFDRLLERTARRAASEEDLRDAYRRLEDIVCEQMPAIPLLFGRAHWALRSDRVVAAAGDPIDRTTGSLAMREIAVRP